VTLPDHAVFGDFVEMVLQFGCMTLWLTIWPLTLAMPFLNNWLSDCSGSPKLPLTDPTRADAAGSCLEALVCTRRGLFNPRADACSLALFQSTGKYTSPVHPTHILAGILYSHCSPASKS